MEVAQVRDLGDDGRLEDVPVAWHDVEERTKRIVRRGEQHGPFCILLKDGKCQRSGFVARCHGAQVRCQDGELELVHGKCCQVHERVPVQKARSGAEPCGSIRLDANLRAPRRPNAIHLGHKDLEFSSERHAMPLRVHHDDVGWHVDGRVRRDGRHRS